MRSFFVIFKYRTIACLIVFFMLVLVGVARLFAISNDSRLVNTTTNTVTVTLSEERGNFYDCHGNRITGAEEYYAVVFLPCENGIENFIKKANKNELETGLSRLRTKKPTVLIREEAFKAEGVYSFAIKKRYADICGLEHLLGYVDDKNHGVLGLEKAFDAELYSSNNVTVSFPYDASGNILVGYEPICSDKSQTNSVYLTIDREIQEICLTASESIEKGAIVVSEIATGKIRALVSRPDFSVETLADYIKRDDAPLINRVFYKYSVGSVFKPLIASALLEQRKNDFEHTCVGYSEFLGLRFECNDQDGHGRMDLTSALTHSCNTYFYNAANKVSADTLTNISSALGFTTDVSLCEGIKIEAGVIPSSEKLSRSTAAIANFAIGQGDIALSPIVLCNLYSAIANDGAYYAPSLVEGIYKENKYEAKSVGTKNIVFSKATAAVLKEALINVVQNGTGVSAKPEEGGAGGKTATAQTGQYKDGKELLNAWFCGFFPAENPRYTVVVMAEGARSGSGNSAPVFKKIADGIGKIK